MVRPLLVRGALVVDGSGGEPFAGDVAVGAGGRIGGIGPGISPEEGGEVVDAGGLVLAPGFVDLHSHSDLYAMVDGEGGLPVGDEPKLLQGCTAQVFGQDGISAAPVAEDDVADYAGYIAGLDGSLPPEAWTWRSFGEYLAALSGRSVTRVAGLVGHSTVRRLVMGMAARPPTEVELEAMTAAVDAAMAEGAIGLSTGLVYAPAAYAGTEELVALCRVVARHQGRFFVHVRSESDRVEEATEEVLEVARRSGVHLHYSHIKTAGRANWARAEAMLAMIQDYRRSGVVVSADVHPYTAGSTTASVLVPPWVLEGGTEAALQRLLDADVRARVRDQVLTDTTSWDNWWAFSDGWTGLRVAGVAGSGAGVGAGGTIGDLAGRSFADIIAGAGVSDLRSQAAFDVVLDLLVSARLGLSLVSFNNVETNVARFMSQPWCSVGSDALVNPGGHPHPRLYGTFPRVLGRFSRELGTMSLPEAVSAMTGRAASVIGRADLGRLEVGARADMVLFDPAKVADRATYDEPRLAPVGIERVWVGGRRLAGEGVIPMS
ncbi:MAG: N-acyl-D-amino-acid deacylase family protein [Acidimicrobiales bacterium]